MAFLASIVSILSILVHHAHAVTSQQIQTDLARILSSSSEVLVTSNLSYPTDFTQRWTIYADARPTYSVAVKPSTVKDVQKIVHYAAKNKVSFLATGGGHRYSTTLSSVRHALNIDLDHFRRVIVDASANTMTVGAASIFADMYDPLYAAGKQMREFGYTTAISGPKLTSPSIWWVFIAEHSRCHTGRGYRTIDRCAWVAHRLLAIGRDRDWLRSDLDGIPNPKLRPVLGHPRCWS
jgi:hypothetical protein